VDGRDKPGHDEGYGRACMTSSADPLVSTDWLATHLGDAGVRVLDASFQAAGATPLAHDDFLAAHIPGAVFFDVDAIADPATDLPQYVPDAAQFALMSPRSASPAAIPVVVYDSGSWMAAPRAWWMFPRLRPRVRQSARRRPEEMARRGARDRKWRRHVGAGPFSTHPTFDPPSCAAAARSRTISPPAPSR